VCVVTSFEDGCILQSTGRRYTSFEKKSGAAFLSFEWRERKDCSWYWDWGGGILDGILSSRENMVVQFPELQML